MRRVWVVERTHEREDAHLVFETSVIGMPTTVTWSGMKAAQNVDLNVTKCCVPPVLINPKHIPQHTRLVRYDDGSLEKAHKHMEAKEKEQADKDEHVQKKHRTST